MSDVRHIETAIDVWDNDAVQLIAECADERTTRTIYEFSKTTGLAADSSALLTDELSALLIADHMTRCESCQRWNWEDGPVH